VCDKANQRPGAPSFACCLGYELRHKAELGFRISIFIIEKRFEIWRGVHSSLLSSIIERHIFPEVVADVRYDAAIGTWAISGQGIKPASLDVKDPNASDDQIQEELYTLQMIYRARIHR